MSPVRFEPFEPVRGEWEFLPSLKMESPPCPEPVEFAWAIQGEHGRVVFACTEGGFYSLRSGRWVRMEAIT